MESFFKSSFNWANKSYLSDDIGKVQGRYGHKDGVRQDAILRPKMFFKINKCIFIGV